METENKHVKKHIGIITFAIIVVIVLYLGVQISNFLSKDVKITGLRNYTTEDKTVSELLVFKDEKTVLSSKNGGCDLVLYRFRSLICPGKER